MSSAAAATTILELLAYRLQRASFYTTKHAHMAFAREFGISGSEWRLIGTISVMAPISMLRLAEETDIQLAQTSRTVAALMERGLVRSEGDRADKRKVMLLLTPAGRALYRKAFAEASRRNQRILSALSEQDCLALFRMLDTGAAEGRVMLDEERRRNA